MNLPSAMALILSENPAGLTAGELALVVGERFPELLAMPGRQRNAIGISPMQALSSAIISASGPRSRRFRRETGISPIRIYLREADRPWTDDELKLAVDEYLAMRSLDFEGKKYVKKAVYRRVALQLGRSEKSVELRMQNISAVLSLLGRRWIKGLMPARNVGSLVASRIETILAKSEGREPDVEFPLNSRPVDRHAVAAEPKGNLVPSKRISVVVRYARDPDVRDWVLNAADGVCDSCREPAPFKSLLGPYLEVHHVRRLADNGEDSISNAVALCPNCHRRLHYGLDAPKRIEALYVRVPRLRRR
jgi:5-methylcytosine-specific restriction protein A